MPPSKTTPSLRRLIVPGLFVAGLFAVVFFRQPPTPVEADVWVLNGATMGTTYTVKVVPEGFDEAAKGPLGQQVQGVLDGVDFAMSTYKTDSEIERFNRSGTEAFEASADFVEVVAEAQRVARLTSGAFDITVGPLVDMWGFGPSGAQEVPDDQALEELVALTGYEQVSVDVEARVLRKARSDCRIDLSAIAKGFAVDEVVGLLEAEGFADFMVEVGGEVRCSGRNSAGEVWRIGIERPEVGGRTVQLAIPLANLALATSGDYRNFVIRDGRRISHTIDPRTGYPISHNLASVSVIHASCMTADALATALEVLGPEEGLELANRLHIPALFILRVEENGFEEVRTGVWVALIENSSGTNGVV
jgi:thiamine biosynthesis lipoprotein